MTPNEPDPKVGRSIVVVSAALIVICFAIYGQTAGFAFINLDDNLYVYDNPAVTSGLNMASLKWAFETMYSANWHPLTWISHILDTTFFGLNAGRHHLVNVIIHAVNSVLAFFTFRRLTGDFWKSAVVAALFAVHPAHVESVAWIAERKDLISTFFWLLTIMAYVDYTRSESDDPSPNAIRRFLSPSYLLVVIYLVLGLMAKPMLVTMPFVLLLFDYWPLARLKRIGDLPVLITEKLPLFALAIGSGVVTLVAQQASGAIEQSTPFADRLTNALVAYVKYIAMMFVPVRLAVWYPPEPIGWLPAVGAAVLLLAISAIVVRFAPRKRYLAVGWFLFVGTLVPVIGLIQVGAQSMADRYTYIPYFGLFITLVWGFAEIMERFGARLQLAIAGFVIVLLGAAAFVQASYWRDNETLYTRTLAVTGPNFLIAHNLCHYYIFADRLAEAEPLCQESLDANPNYVDAHNTFGILRLKQGRLEESERVFRETIDRWPGYSLAVANLVTTLIAEQKPEEAEKYLQQAGAMSERDIDPATWVVTLKSLAELYLAQNKPDRAIENYARAVYLAPGRADLRLAAASALYRRGNYVEALNQAQAAVTLDPNNADGFNVAGKAYAAQNMGPEATQMFERAIQLRPDFAEAKANLSALKARNTP